MMNWSVKDWVQWHEQSLREAVLTPDSGFSLQEGFNKFGPTPEKQSSGSYEGIISDRGAFGAPGGPGVAPTTLQLTWAWDFRDPRSSSCSVQANFITATGGTQKPVAGSLSVTWRGDAGAAGHDGGTAIAGDVRADASCPAGTGDDKWITISGVDGANITEREGSNETTAGMPADAGKVYRRLPNNGMLKFDLGGGKTFLLGGDLSGDRLGGPGLFGGSVGGGQCR